MFLRHDTQHFNHNLESTKKLQLRIECYSKDSSTCLIVSTRKRTCFDSVMVDSNVQFTFIRCKLFPEPFSELLHVTPRNCIEQVHRSLLNLSVHELGYHITCVNGPTDRK